MKNVINVTDESFNSEVLNSELPVLVDFWATWCGPCKAVAPHIEAVADDFIGKAKVTKMNIDENIKTPPAFGIRSIPTLLVFKGGEVVGQIVGNPGSKSKIADLLNKSLD